MSRWMGEWVDGWMSTDGWKDVCVDGGTFLMGGWKDVCMYG